VNPEDYPDINKLAILADVAPYSREYNTRVLRPAQPKNSARGRTGAGPWLQARAAQQSYSARGCY
jgi:hypothetical protein